MLFTLFVSCNENFIVGRCGQDVADRKGMFVWVVGDKIKKEAVLNAVQIAEWLVANGEVKS